MKLLVVLVLVFVAVSSRRQTFSDVIDTWITIVEPHRLACIEESLVEEKLANRVLSHGEFVETKPLKCYLKCLYERESLINDVGEFQPQVMNEKISIEDKRVVKVLVERCINIQDDDVCQKIFNIGKCVYHYVQEMLDP